MSIFLTTLFAISAAGLGLGIALTALRHRSRTGPQTFFDRLCRKAEG